MPTTPLVEFLFLTRIGMLLDTGESEFEITAIGLQVIDSAPEVVFASYITPEPGLGRWYSKRPDETSEDRRPVEAYTTT
jgi:hypothetical protein